MIRLGFVRPRECAGSCGLGFVWPVMLVADRFGFVRRDCGMAGVAWVRSAEIVHTGLRRLGFVRPDRVHARFESPLSGWGPTHQPTLASPVNPCKGGGATAKICKKVSINNDMCRNGRIRNRE